MTFSLFLRRFLHILLLLPLWAGLFAEVAAQGTPKAVVVTERVRAELMAHAPQGIEPGKPVWVGLQLTHQPDWHTYWKNSGDSGLPTVLEWQLPSGIVAGDIAWPVPHKIAIGTSAGTLANYGYEGQVLLPVPLTITPTFKPPMLGHELEVKLKASWLVCRKECIPEDGEFLLKVSVKSTTALNGAAFDASFAAQPQTFQGNSSVTLAGNALKLSLTGLPAKLQGQTLDFFPETPEVIETAAQWTQAWTGNTWTAEVPLSPQRSAAPSHFPMVVGLSGSHWRMEPAVTGTWPQGVTASGVSPALQAALANNAAQNKSTTTPTPAPSLGLWMALLGAVLGGLILNLMPCVFPVLAIKVLGFAQAAHQGDTRSHLRQQGLAYTAGVVLSFIALGGLLLALRAGGEQLGWGFQLQSPAMVAALATLFTLIALNLLGVFEVGMVLPSRAMTAQTQHPVANALLSGVLTVAVASPCTAPFMGASLGLAIALPPLEALSVFAAIGVGMALPYLLASSIPGVARALPKPGAWMDVLRRFMAFPMLATVVWLVWVLGQQSGMDGAGALLALLLTMSLLVWALSLSGRSRILLASLSGASLLALVIGLGPVVLAPSTDNTSTASGPTASAADWQPWTTQRVNELQAQGQTVFVDFTAAWCVTCQYNKKTTLANAQVRADLSAKHIALLQADWTRRDPAITAALASLGRNGVPVYVFYKPGQAPVVLSEILSVDEVRSVIATL